MEQNPEKKPVKGQVFLKRLGQKLAGDPNPKTPEDEAKKYKAKTEAAVAKNEYLKTEEEIANPPSLKELQEKEKQRLADAATKAQDRADAAETRERDRIQKDADTAAEQAAAEQQKREEAEKALQSQHTQMLLDKLTELQKSQKPMSEQFTEYFTFVDQLADKLGYQKPGTVKPISENPQIALEIAKLNLEEAQRDREFQLKMKASDRDWDLKLLEIKDNREFRKAELAQKAKRDEQLFAFPEVIGGAIAKGLIDSQAGVTGSVRQPAEGAAKPSHIEIPEGEGGDFECPGCHSRIGVGPTSTEAVCVGCNNRLPVVRTQSPHTQVKEEEGTII